MDYFEKLVQKRLVFKLRNFLGFILDQLIDGILTRILKLLFSFFNRILFQFIRLFIFFGMRLFGLNFLIFAFWFGLVLINYVLRQLLDQFVIKNNVIFILRGRIRLILEELTKVWVIKQRVICRLVHSCRANQIWLLRELHLTFVRCVFIRN